MATRAEQHRPAGWKDRKTQERARQARTGTPAQRGYDARWRRFRLHFLAHNPMCQAPGCPYPANEVDHVIPHRGDQVLFWDETNMQALCKACHSAKTAREITQREGARR